MRNRMLTITFLNEIISNDHYGILKKIVLFVSFAFESFKFKNNILFSIFFREIHNNTKILGN